MGNLLLLKEYLVISGLIIATSLFFAIFFKESIYYKQGFLIGAVTTIAYFSHNPLIFFALAFFFVKFFNPKISAASSLGLYFLLLPVIPDKIYYVIPFPGLEQLFTLNYTRILNIAVLLPLFLKFARDPRKKIFSFKLDKYVAIFLLYCGIISFRDTTFTNALRINFYLFLDAFLIYFAVSRSIRKFDDFKEVILPMAFTAFFLAIMAVFEAVKAWHMYLGLLEAMGMPVPLAPYTPRMDSLRAYGPFFGPISCGVYFCIMTGLLLYLILIKYKKAQVILSLAMLIFIIATICTFSRGPILGYALFFLIFGVLSFNKIVKLIPLFLLLFFVILALPITGKVISVIPGLGQEEQGTVTYRQKLLNNAIEVARQNPLFGSGVYLEEEKMKELTTGLQIIDIVNSYVGIMLRYGYIGVLFFVSIFIKALFSVYKLARHRKDEEESLLGKILFSITAAFAIVIFTVSLIYPLREYMWILIGLCAAYVAVIKTGQETVLNEDRLYND